MSNLAVNPCTRCGKERILAKSWKEKVTNFFGESEVTYTETICADPDCQDIVNKQNNADKEKWEQRKQNQIDKMNKKFNHQPNKPLRLK